MEGAVRGEEAVGGKDVQVGMEDEVVAESVDGCDGAEFPVGEIEADAKGVAEALGGGAEEDGEVGAAFAEDAAEDLGDGEDELAVGDVVADGTGDPFAGAPDAALVAGGAEVTGLAGEGEEALVAAIGAVEPGEAGGEIPAAEKGLDGGDGLVAQRAEVPAMASLVLGEEVVPAVMDELPEGRSLGTAGSGGRVGSPAGGAGGRHDARQGQSRLELAVPCNERLRGMAGRNSPLAGGR